MGNFRGTTFTESVNFTGATFTGGFAFDGATFTKGAGFYHAKTGRAGFDDATFIVVVM